MKSIFIILSAVLMALLGGAAEAQGATCVVGPSGGALTAKVSFTAPTVNTDGSPIATPLTYNLYQSTTAGAETKVLSALSGTSISVTTGLKAATTYYFKVSVVDSNGTESALSNEVCKTFPASVPGVVTITVQ